MKVKFGWVAFLEGRRFRGCRSRSLLLGFEATSTREGTRGGRSTERFSGDTLIPFKGKRGGGFGLEERRIGWQRLQDVGGMLWRQQNSKGLARLCNGRRIYLQRERGPDHGPSYHCYTSHPTSTSSSFPRIKRGGCLKGSSTWQRDHPKSAPPHAQSLAG